MKISIVLLASVLTFVACSTQPLTQSDTHESSASSIDAIMNTSAAMSSDTMMVSSSSQPQARVIEMTVENFAFVPSTINVKRGEHVIIRVTGVTGLHSFGAPELGLNVRVDLDQTVDIVLPTDTAGSFAFRCMIPCGTGHKNMVGTIIIS